jgi:hypothetical protein
MSEKAICNEFQLIILQVVLNRRDKEQLVIKLHQESKSFREIASIAHLSFSDIGAVIRKIDGKDDGIEMKDLKNKSKGTQALFLLTNGKKPIEVAIELDLPSIEVENMQQEYWVLNQLDELALIYHEIRSHLTLFLRLFHIMKRNKMINEKDIQNALRYAADDLPSLEDRIYKLTNYVMDLESKKRVLKDTITLWNAQLSDLGREIDIKNQQLKRMSK